MPITTTDATDVTREAPDEAPESLLQIDAVRVEFGPLVAVRDVSLRVQGGHLLGLIGPNGAGKTTLLRTVAGLQPRSGGAVRVLGQEVTSGSPALRHVGFTPDTPIFYDDLTVAQFLRFVAMGYGLPAGETEERIDFWLEKVWLGEKRGQKVKSLSRGMRQRLGIARTLLPNPHVILLDEPAAGLDPAGRVQFRQLLCDLREQGKALIVSSHILADMSEYCTHIGIMAAGQIVQYGTVAQVAAHATEGRCRYAVHLAHPVVRIAEQLADIEGLSDVQSDRDRMTFEYPSDHPSAARLLVELVRRGLPVASFAPLAPGLEEAYLRTGIRQVD